MFKDTNLPHHSSLLQDSAPGRDTLINKVQVFAVGTPTMLPNDQTVSDRRQSSGHCGAAKEQESKRKTSNQSGLSTCEGPPRKKNRRLESAGSSKGNQVGSDSQYGQEIQWKEYFGDWPPSVAEQSMSAQDLRTFMYSYTLSRSNSYSQRVRDRASLGALQRQNEEMEAAGLFMISYRTQASITDECQELCDKLLKADYAVPAAYQPDRLVKLLTRVRFCNKARLVRDVTSIIVPSPELLRIHGHAELDTICETLNEEWTLCNPLFGPTRPKPDFVAGVSATAFTKEEKEKLLMSHTSTCPNQFPESLYFPFLICEVNDEDDHPIGEAERKAMHSASIATRAVIELFRKVSATAEVHQKILAFSVVHNHSMIMIFAHFSTINDQQTHFFRLLLYSNCIGGNPESTALTKPYMIIRAIYEHFVPQHLARIRGALSRMDPAYMQR